MEKQTNKKEERDEKLIDLKLKKQLAKSLGETTNNDEKIAFLTKKYIEFEKDNKRLQATIKLNGKQIENILREKENLQKDYNKSVLMREKLEEVCRELQKITKSVQNESMQKINEGEERLKESQSKFQQAIKEVNESLNVNIDENNKLRDYNIEMSKKMKYLTDSNTTREKQLEKINEQVKLESQLNDAKLAKLQMESAIEKEILLREKQAALNDLLLAKKALKDLTDREQILKEQLNIYTSKYDDFQSSLQKSNDMFSSYKTEINKMSKNANKLEKEAIDWKLKWQKCNMSLIVFASEKKERDEYVEKCTKQVQQLQKLLRALQAERKQLYSILRENNIEPPSIAQLPDEPVPITPLSLVPTQTDKMDLMAKNCAELKQTLANLQGQMKDITSKQSNNLASTQSTNQPQKKKKNKKSTNKSKQCSIKETSNSQQDELNEVIEEPNLKLNEKEPTTIKNEIILNGTTDASNDVSNKSSNIIEEEITEETKSKITEVTISEISEGTKSEVTEGTKSEVTEGTKSEVTKGTKSEVTEGTKSEVTEGTQSEVTEGRVSEVTEEQKPEIPENNTELNKNEKKIIEIADEDASNDNINILNENLSNIITNFGQQNDNVDVKKKEPELEVHLKKEVMILATDN